MADIGAVGRSIITTAASRKVVPSVVYRQRAAGDPAPISFDVSGTLSGVAETFGVPKAGIRVGLYYRSNMQLIAAAVTDASGAYSFDGLNRSDLEAYFIVAQDPSETPPFLGTQVHDHLTAG